MRWGSTVPRVTAVLRGHLGPRFWKAATIAVAGVIPALLVAACAPTGNSRCDAYPGPQIHIEGNGWTLDCAPPDWRSNDGVAVLGWADSKSDTVYVWPNRISSDKTLRKVLWHEAGHSYGIADEWLADVFAFCHMTAAEWQGVGFKAPMPKQSDCARVP